MMIQIKDIIVILLIIYGRIKLATNVLAARPLKTSNLDVKPVY